MERLSWSSMLRTVRAPLSVVIVVGFALLLPPQTADMLVALTDGASPFTRPAASFHFALFLLAVSAWYWARTALTARFEIADTAASRAHIVTVVVPLQRAALDWTPRALFVAVVGIAAAAAWRNGAWLHVLYVGVWGSAGLLMIVFRLRIQGWLAALRVGVAAPQATAELRSTAEFIAWMRHIPRRFLALLDHAPYGRCFALGWLLLGLGFFVAGAVFTFLPDFAWAPDVWLGRRLPEAGAAIFCMALAIPPFTVLTFVFDGLRIEGRFLGAPWRLRRPPVLLVFWLIVLLTPTWFSLHVVRLAPDAPGSAGPADRRELGTVFAEWVRACAPNNDLPVRPVIIAVSGGASRAGLWAARVLLRVEEAEAAVLAAHPDANVPTIFAVSSVSGGSLGAAGYMALRAGQPPADRCRLQRAVVQRDETALAWLGHDALGPPLAGMLMGDVPRALIGPLLQPFGGPRRGGDRAEAIERGFEALWEDSLIEARDPQSQAVRFSAPFLSLRAAGMAVWIGNGTDAQNGARVVTAPFKPDPSGWPFLGAYDALGMLGADVRISTAINNTARFPVLEPSGELRPKTAARALTDPRQDEQPTQLIDGGYFDNEGVLTARELADWLVQYGEQQLHRPVRPIIVQATADAERAVTAEKVVRCGSLLFDPAHSAGSKRPVQLLAPLLGLNSVRSAHAEAVLREVRDDYCRPDWAQQAQAFFHFYLHAAPEADVPLNWVLSDHMTRYIWNRAIDACGNAQEYERLRASFAEAPTQPAGPVGCGKQ